MKPDKVQHVQSLAVIVRKDLKGAERIANAFRSNGFRVAWSETTFRHIHVPKLNITLLLQTDDLEECLKRLRMLDDRVYLMIRLGLNDSVMELQRWNFEEKIQALPFIDEFDLTVLVKSIQNAELEESTEPGIRDGPELLERALIYMSPDRALNEPAQIAPLVKHYGNLAAMINDSESNQIITKLCDPAVAEKILLFFEQNYFID